MKLAERTLNLKASATLALNAKNQELRAQGKKILSLTVGEPDFPTPEHICTAAKKAIDDGFTRYTAVPGLVEVRSAAADYFVTQYNVKASAENIILSNGGKQALFNLFQILLDQGDHVLIPAPCWVSYPVMIELSGAKPILVPALAQNNFKLSVAELEASLTPKTKMIILNSPSNPTGACYTQKELDAIAAWAVSHKIFVLADEVYDQLVYDGLQPLSLCAWWQKHPESFAIVNSAAKTFSMTGWRVGYTLAHPKYIKVLSNYQGQSTSNICTIAQKATEAALRGGLKTVEEMRVVFERRRNLAMDIIDTWPDVVCPRPSGAFYVFPDIHAHYTKAVPDSTSFCEHLLEKAEVMAVPGAPFGDDKCIRFSYATQDDVLEQALLRMGKLLTK